VDDRVRGRSPVSPCEPKMLRNTSASVPAPVFFPVWTLTAYLTTATHSHQLGHHDNETALTCREETTHSLGHHSGTGDFGEVRIIQMVNGTSEHRLATL